MVLEPRPGPHWLGDNRERAEASAQGRVGAQRAISRASWLELRKSAGKWAGHRSVLGGCRVLSGPPIWMRGMGTITAPLPLRPGGGAGSHSRHPCRPLQSRCAVQVRKRGCRRGHPAARLGERGPRWGSSGAHAAAPPPSCRITGISLSVLKQIDPSEQKTLANLPWIVEPGQEAKRGINTKYETTIF